MPYELCEGSPGYQMNDYRSCTTSTGINDDSVTSTWFRVFSCFLWLLGPVRELLFAVGVCVEGQITTIW